MAGNTARNYGGAGGNMVPRSTKLTEALANTMPQAGTNRSGGGSGYSYNMNGTPMGPQEVQDVVAQNAQNAVNAAAGTNAAQAAALQLEPGLQVNGMGQNGTGNWYSLLGAGGKVDPNNAALFLAMNPGAYNSPYTPAMQTLMNQLLNPEQFRYDVNADGLYQQIKDNYQKAGKQAMMDTQGQSAALTGGYGNSYGAMAGQQAYQESLGGLAGMIPELQQLAYQQYLNGEDAKRNNLEALNKLNEQEYARWMDDMAAYVQALGNLQLPAGNSGGGGGDPGVVGGPMNPFGKFLITNGQSNNNNRTINLDTVIALQKEFKNGTLDPYSMSTAAALGTIFPGVDQASLDYAVMQYTGNDPNGNKMAVPWAADSAPAQGNAPTAGKTNDTQAKKNQDSYSKWKKSQ